MLDFGAGNEPDIGMFAADELTSCYLAKLKEISLLVLKCWLD